MDFKIYALQRAVTKLETDLIVSAANFSFIRGEGVEGAVQCAGDPQLSEDCSALIAKQGICEKTGPIITFRGKRRVRYGISVMDLICYGGHHHNHDKLSSYCRSSLNMEKENATKSISFSATSTGIYRFPKANAAAIVMAYKMDSPKISSVSFSPFLSISGELYFDI